MMKNIIVLLIEKEVIMKKAKIIKITLIIVLPMILA